MRAGRWAEAGSISPSNDAHARLQGDYLQSRLREREFFRAAVQAPRWTDASTMAQVRGHVLTVAVAATKTSARPVKGLLPAEY